MKLASLFDGIGGSLLSAKICGIQPVWASEIEPFPIKVTKHHFPEVKHYGDITQIKGDQIEPVDIVVGGSPCFPANTLVLTQDGYKPIKTINPGEKVLTHTGKWQKVLKTGGKKSSTIKLIGQGHWGIECTRNHPFYSAEKYRTWNSDRRNYDVNIKNITWTDAEHMKGKMWACPVAIDGVIPIPAIEQKSCFCNEPPEMNEDFWWLVGRWLGDGWTRNTQRKDRRSGVTHGNVFISCGTHRKQGVLDRLKKVIPTWCETEDNGNCVKFRVSHTGLADWLDCNFGKYAHGKRIPAFCFTLDKESRTALLEGLKSADGYQQNENSVKISTVSKNMALGIRLIAETLGYSTSIWKTITKNQTVIEGRTVNQRDYYNVRISSAERLNGFKTKQHSWNRVRKITESNNKTNVYNLEVENDNSYVVENIVVHNCQDLSVAGKRKGLSGERSGLFMEQIRIVKEMRDATNGNEPRFMVWENVPGAFSSNKGEDFRAVLEETARIADPTISIPRPPDGWRNSGSILADGFSISWRTFDAQYWGVPQRRRRIYLVADFGGQSAPEILFESEGLSGDITQSQGKGQGTAENAEGCVGDAEPIVLNDQGGAFMDVSNIAGTLRAQMGGHQPIICSATQQGNAERLENLSPTITAAAGMAGNMGPWIALEPAICIQGSMIGRADKNGPQGDGINEDVSFTLNTADRHAVCYGIDQQGGKGAANYTENVSPTILSDSHGTPHAVCYNGENLTSPTNAQNPKPGDPCHTLGTDSRNYVCYGMTHASDVIRESGDKTPVLQHRMGTGGNQVPLVFELHPMDARVTGPVDMSPTVTSHFHKGSADTPLVCKDTTELVNKQVRRLTPLECERLQGYPSGYTNIPGASDTARYKALGNSFAIPNILFVLRSIKAATPMTNEQKIAELNETIERGKEFSEQGYDCETMIAITIELRDRLIKETLNK